MEYKPKIYFGPYVFDQENECLWREKERIALRPKAYAVLSYLLSHPGVLVTKEQLLQVVWQDTLVTDAVLKDCIRQLREALRDHAKDSQFIQTVHRRGYRFIAELRKASADSSAAKYPPPQAAKVSIFGAAEQPAQLLGRDERLSQLRTCLETALNGESQCLFVTGEAGIGKTTLVDAFLKEASTIPEILIGKGDCLEQYGAGEAYLPVLDAMSRLANHSLGSLVVDQLRLFAPSWLTQLPKLGSASEFESLRTHHVTRERMLREMGDAIEGIVNETPLILVIEDLHWSDYSTLDLISYLARKRNRGRFMLIGTYRPVEVVLNEHPLKAIKQELQVHRLCVELPLEYFSAKAVAEYLTTKFPNNDFPLRFTEIIHNRTEGNPLFIVNMIKYLIDLGQIVEVDGKHTLTIAVDDVGLEVPDNIRHLIDKHIERLTESNQRILEGASVVGMDCSAVAIAAGLDADVVEVEEVCDRLARNHQFLLPAYLAELPDGTITPRYRFIHSLYTDVLYKRIPPTKRTRIHGKIGQRGEEIYGDRVVEIAAELAVHFEEARDLQRALKYLILAIQNAENRSAHHEAISLARRGLNILDGMEATDERMTHQRLFIERLVTQGQR